MKLLSTAKSDSPSFLAVDKNGTTIYAVNELSPEGYLSVYEMTGDKRELELKSKHGTQGEHPCHVSVDETSVYVTNYTSGGVTSYAKENGHEPMNFKHEGKLGSNTER